MKAFVCEMCGNNQLTKIDGFFQCDYCGTKYTLEEAKKLFVSGTVEVTKGDAEKERLITNAQKFIDFEQYSEARKILDTITFQFPDDYRGWWMEYTIPFLEFIRNKKEYSYFPSVTFSKDLDNASKLFNIEKEYNALWEKVADTYFKWCNNSNFRFKDLFEDKTPQILNKAFCAIKEDAAEKLKYSNFVKNYLMDNLNTGKTKKILLYKGIKHDRVNSLIEGLKDNLRYGKTDETITSYCIIQYYVNKILTIKHHDCWEGRMSEEYLEFNSPLTYSDMGLCSYCGGEFKGLRKKTCSKCGKPKDY